MAEPKKPRDVGASVRARLLTLARQKGQAFDLLLTRYANERLLHRLSLSPHRSRFVLKGAMLMTTWFDDPHRPTRDVDFLGYGDPAPEAMLVTFREICAIEVDDGIVFDVDALRVELIREELEYGGLRLRTTGALAGARISVIIDIGFGDAIEPGIEEVNLPVLLDLPQPRLRVYARETVIAEKFQAMVMLGLANSRMKDFYDVWTLSRSYDFDEDRLSRAIAATFERRGTAIPFEAPVALTQTFATDVGKQRQWAAFVRDLAIEIPVFEAVVADLAGFLMPYARHARQRS
ncbi:nucleotidyl transferase AbiEii/AbiGii toxin family protein [Rhodoferax ferrireducens]|jgi:predicted nucleotidyltransferase component of viral defense system|uniref:nucleotidyl transferase AbiEii/AbiGii toxin family protein n=1 Tax=Rhodoferax ferrireducens TaxID=192843 RepID=UPI003BB5680D